MIVCAVEYRGERTPARFLKSISKWSSEASDWVGRTAAPLSLSNALRGHPLHSWEFCTDEWPSVLRNWDLESCHCKSVVCRSRLRLRYTDSMPVAYSSKDISYGMDNVNTEDIPELPAISYQ